MDFAMIGAPPNLSGRKLSAILYADIHGFARLMDLDEAGTIARVERSLALMRKVVSDYGGSVENIAGDGILALFSSASQALHFAVEIQKELSNEAAWSQGLEPIAYRIGIAIGDTVSDGTMTLGHAVNLAARIQELSEPGGICISDGVYHAVRDKSELGFRSLGRPKLKNITDTLEIFAVEPNRKEPPAEIQILPTERPPQRRIHECSLAVLPFENVSGDPADMHLCQGVVADLISALCRFRNLMVTARHSAFLVAAQAKSLRVIGQQLGVRYVLSGGFRRVGHRIRITVELNEAEGENTIWSERYDGTLADIFTFQDDVIAATASRLAAQIDMAERRRVLAQNHPNLHSYGLVLRGQELCIFNRQDSNSLARRLFEQARDLDPRYGRTYAAISRTLNVEWRYGWAHDPAAALSDALKLAAEAVRNDDLDARGYSEMGLAHLYKKEHDASLAAYEKALDLNPNDADLLAEMGDCLAYVRQADRGVSLLQRAIRLNPYHPDFYLWYLGDAYFHLGDYENTIQTLRKMRDPSEGHRLMAASHALLGQKEDARRHARALLEVHPNFSIRHWQTVPPNKYPEDLEVFVEGLRMAGLR